MVSSGSRTRAAPRGGVAEQNCPESDRAAREVLSLPMHPYLDDAAQIKVAQALQEAHASSVSVPYKSATVEV